MSIVQLVRTFAAETDIFGFRLFKRRRSTFDAVFWCTLVTVFGCYTTKSLIEICVKYQNEETITDVRLAKDDDFFLPDPILYFTASASTAAPPADVPFEVLLSEFEETGDLKGSNFWRALVFFYHLHKVESRSTLGTPESLLNTKNLTDDFLQALAALGARSGLLARLSDLVFVKLCESFRPKVSFQAGGTVTPGAPKCARKDLMIKHVPKPLLCLNLDARHFAFRYGTDQLIIELNFTAESLRREVGVDEATVGFALDGYNYVSGGEIVVITDQDSEAELLVNANRRYHARLNAVYRNLNLRRQRCEPDRGRSAFCDEACRSAFFLDLYACWPTIFVPHFSALQNATNGRRCDAIDYLNYTADADKVRRASEKLADCRRRCFPACEKPLFAITAESSSTPSELTVANILLQSHVYMRVDERLADDFEGVLSRLGGTLGLWLGVNFGSIVHFVIFVGQSIVGALARVKRKSKVRPKIAVQQEGRQRVKEAEFSL